MVQSADGRQVPVVQAYAYGKYLGYLKVTFDKEGNVLKSTGNPILLDSSVPQGKTDVSGSSPGLRVNTAGLSNTCLHVQIQLFWPTWRSGRRNWPTTRPRCWEARWSS